MVGGQAFHHPPAFILNFVSAQEYNMADGSDDEKRIAGTERQAENLKSGAHAGPWNWALLRL